MSDLASLMALALCEQLLNLVHLHLELAVKHCIEGLVLLINLCVNCLDLGTVQDYPGSYSEVSFP